MVSTIFQNSLVSTIFQIVDTNDLQNSIVSTIFFKKKLNSINDFPKKLTIFFKKVQWYYLNSSISYDIKELLIKNVDN